MSEPRSFSVCQGCGVWKEINRNFSLFFADYDMAFFIEQHGSRCPVTGKLEMFIVVNEVDPDFKPLSPEKQWRPETCPGYTPPQETKFTRYTSKIRERLIGLWTTRNFGGQSDEMLILLKDGNGALDFYNAGFAGRQPLQWSLKGEDEIHIDASGVYFKTEVAYFELGCFINRRGQETDLIRIFDRGRDSRPTEFFRSKQPLDDYKIPEDEKG